MRASAGAPTAAPGSTARNGASVTVAAAATSAVVLLLAALRWSGQSGRGRTGHGYTRINGGQRTTTTTAAAILSRVCPCFPAESLDTAAEVERIFDEPLGGANDEDDDDEMYAM